MINILKILRYLLIFCVVYFGLVYILGIPGVRDGYMGWFSKTSDSIVSTLLPGAFVHFQPQKVESSTGNYKVKVLFANQEEVNRQIAAAKSGNATSATIQGLHNFTFEMDMFFRIPICFFLALLMVSPLKILRKINALVLGLLLYFIYSQALLYFYILDKINEAAIGVYSMGSFGGEAVRLIKYLVGPGILIMSVVLIWIFVTFRKGNWKDFLTRFTDEKK